MLKQRKAVHYCFYLALLFFFIFMPSTFALVVDDGKDSSLRGVVVENPPNVANVSQYNVSSAEYWRTDEGVLDNVADISHSWLDDLAWSVAGHIIDTDVDMDGNSLLDIDKTYFSGTDFISSDDNGHLDFHAEVIDFHGNMSSIWNIILNADLTGTYGGLYFGAQRDVVIGYNDTALNITGGDVYFSGNIYSPNLPTNSSINGSYVPYTGATSNVDLGSNNLTTTGTGEFGSGAILGTEEGSPLWDGDATATTSRVFLMPSAGNRQTNFIMMPLGTADSSTIQVSNDDDVDNRGRLVIRADGTDAKITTDAVGTGTQPTIFIIGEQDTTAATLLNIKFQYGNGNVFADFDIDNGVADFQGNNITTTGNITADYFFGDGSELTGMAGEAIEITNDSVATGDTYLLTSDTWSSVNSVINNIKLVTECESMNISICGDSGCTDEDKIYAERFKNASTYGSYTYINDDSLTGVYVKYHCNSGAETCDIYLGGVTA